MLTLCAQSRCGHGRQRSETIAGPACWAWSCWCCRSPGASPHRRPGSRGRPARSRSASRSASGRPNTSTLPWDDVYDAALDLSPTIIRLGAYWDEIEPYEGVYDWSTLDAQLDLAERARPGRHPDGRHEGAALARVLPPVLARTTGSSLDDGATVSDNAEIRGRTLAFVERVVRRYRDHAAVAYWQVENEPLDPAGPRGWQIGPGFLAQEVELVRELDRRPVIVTMFVEVNPMLLAPWRQQEVRSRAAMLLNLGDVLGLDLYPSRGYPRARRRLVLQLAGLGVEADGRRASAALAGAWGAVPGSWRPRPSRGSPGGSSTPTRR